MVCARPSCFNSTFLGYLLNVYFEGDVAVKFSSAVIPLAFKLVSLWYPADLVAYEPVQILFLFGKYFVPRRNHQNYLATITSASLIELGISIVAFLLSTSKWCSKLG